MLSFLIGIQLKSPENIKKVCDTSHFSIFTAYLMLSLNEKINSLICKKTDIVGHF